LVKIDPTLLFVQLLTFGLAVLLLWRLFWKPLAKFMRDRADRVDHDIRSARTLRAEAEQLKVHWDTRMADAEEKANAILQLGAEEGGRRRAEIVRDAEAEAKRIIEEAGNRIAEERRRTARELQTQTVALAMLIAEQALRQSVDQSVQERLVKEFAQKLSGSPDMEERTPNA
jgi:F-type H+-transporting ATPase subunit b